MAPSEAAIRRALWGLLILVMVGVVGAGARSLLRGRPAGGGGEAEAPAGPPVYGRVPDFSLIERSGRRVQASELRGLVWIADFIYTHCTDTCPLQSAQMARLQAEFTPATDLRFVSITVDPARDTPQVLARYAARFGADPARWLFLTGEKAAIFHLAREGFRLGVEEPVPTKPSPLDKAFPPERGAAPGAPSPFPSPPSGGEGPSKHSLSLLRERAGVRAGRLFEAAPAMAHEPAGTPAPAPAPSGARGPILHSSRFVLVDRQARIRGYYEGGDDEALRRLRRDVQILLKQPRP